MIEGKEMIKEVLAPPYIIVGRERLSIYGCKFSTGIIQDPFYFGKNKNIPVVDFKLNMTDMEDAVSRKCPIADIMLVRFDLRYERSIYGNKKYICKIDSSYSNPGTRTVYVRAYILDILNTPDILNDSDVFEEDFMMQTEFLNSIDIPFEKDPKLSKRPKQKIEPLIIKKRKQRKIIFDEEIN